jgi:hypothetical protein
MIFVDSHVHIHDCFDIGFLLDSAFQNFQNVALEHAESGQAASFVLLLTERNNEKWFKRISMTLEKTSRGEAPVAKNWKAVKTDSSDSLMVVRADSAEKKMYVVAGRQVVTREKIEVLSIYSREHVGDGLSLIETVTLIGQAGAIPVLPWGAGKWFGKRGEKIRKFLSEKRGSKVYLGDNGGRPNLWPTPTLFRLAADKGIAVLPGSDVLPLQGEAGRIGTYGFYLNDTILPGVDPAMYLKTKLLSQEAEIMPFGSLLKNSRFVFNQLHLRFSS